MKLLRTLILAVFALFTLTSAAFAQQATAFLSSTSVSSDSITTASLTGVETIRVQCEGTGFYYTFWNGQENDQLAEVESTQVVSGSGDKVVKITIPAASAPNFYQYQAIEIRESDDTTVRARGIVKGVQVFSVPYKINAPTGQFVILGVVLNTAVGSEIDDTDGLWGLDPDRTGKVGAYIPAAANGNGGFILSVPGLSQRDGVIAFVRDAASTGALHLDAVYAPGNVTPVR